MASEDLTLGDPIRCEGNIENWLRELEIEM